MEHALVFASIIVGVAVSDQVMSLNRLLLARDRVRWDWAPLAVALAVVLTNLQVWWSIASPDARPVSIGGFLPTLVELVLLALLSAASLPDAGAADADDLTAYYERHARYLWTLYALALGWVTAVGVVEAGRQAGLVAAIQQREGDLIPLAVMIGLIFIRRRWFLICAMLFLSLGPIGWLSRTLT